MSGAASMSYLSLRTNSMAKDAEEKRSAAREKAMLIFAFQLLIEKGYLDTATCLSKECSLKLEEFSICENIDLRSIFIEFETYYHVRYQRYPQYFKKTSLTATEMLLNQMKANNQNQNKGSANKRGTINNNNKASGNPAQGGSEKCLEMEEPCSSTGTISTANSAGRGLRNLIGPINQHNQHNHSQSNHLDPAMLHNHNSSTITMIQDFTTSSSTNKLLKPISCLEFPNEDARLFAEMIQREIVVQSLGTKWTDVIGLDEAKQVLEQTFSYTKEFLDFFGNGLSPWKGLLLFGPPGVGKTLLAKAVATECKTTFFNISSASLISKWRGDSEKIVKTLFDLAKYHAPSTIFFDEFDALGSKRDGNLTDSDAARRFKSELLQQMDGLMSSANSSSAGNNGLQIFILAASNLPWELDPAILRRLEKRIYIPLPNSVERIQIFKLYFGRTAKNVIESSNGRNVLACQLDFEKLSMETEDYSGSDLQQIVKDTVIRKFRDKFRQQQKIRQLIIRTEDVLFAIESVSPTVSESLVAKYKQWSTNNI